MNCLAKVLWQAEISYYSKHTLNCFSASMERLVMEPTTKTLAGWTGYVMHFLLAAMMIMAGGMKLVVSPEDMGEPIPEGIKNHFMVIGAGEVLCGVLLLSMATLPSGLILSSAFWGGAIMATMIKEEGYGLQAGLLIFLWVGAALRRPGLVLPFVYEQEMPLEGRLPGSEPPPA
jgi:Na+/proline symporter